MPDTTPRNRPDRYVPRPRYRLVDDTMQTMRLTDLIRILDETVAGAGGKLTNSQESRLVVQTMLQKVVDELYTMGLLPMACLVEVNGSNKQNAVWYDLVWQTRRQ